MKRRTLQTFVVAVGTLASLSAHAQTIESTSESTPYPGIRLVEGRTSGPATDFYAAYVSLCTRDVHVDASGYDGASTSASWGSSAGAELAVNGDFFSYSPRAHIYGDAVSGGQRWSLNRTGLHDDYSGDWYYQRYGWIAFGDDFVEFTNTEWVKNNFERFQSLSGWKPREITGDLPPGTKALVSGFPQLVVDGAPIECSSPTDSSCFPDRSDMRDRHPRTAMGLSRDGQTFILVVVDGRSASSAGMYGAELAQLMDQLGAHVAFNLDGGGSSQMWLRGEGTISNPSDGSPRAVLNHWGIFAGGGDGLPAIPGHCDNRWDGLIHQLAGQVQRTTDIDGDGQGDACIRTAEGVSCSLFSDGAFGPEFAGPALRDDSGWGDPSNYATMRWGDIDGDGRADLCARANAGIRCWRSTGDGFGDSIVGPPLDDDSGFDRPMYYSTIRLLDLDGDGRDDLCARWNDSVRCYPSTGDSFGDAIDGPPLSNDSGWSAPHYYGTIRTGDVDGDGTDDLCARASRGMVCWLSEGGSFSQQIDGPEWSDEAGWGKFRYWSTIRLVDLDHDGSADLCGRAPTGVRCHLSTGDGFGPEIRGPGLSDDNGWNDYSNYATLRFADVTGEGALDACARSDDGVRCWPFDRSSGTFSSEPISGPLIDSSGWTRQRFHRTIDFVDLDADGDADLCARAARGLVCWRSLGNRFEAELIEGPEWSDEAGMGAARYYGTMSLLGRVRPAPVEESGEDGGTSPGGPDAGPPTTDGGGPVDTGATGGDGGSTPPPRIEGEGGCGCVTSPAPTSAPTLFILFAIVAVRRRR